jgi:drug/metabolite transporter (DMT)-like permease
VGLVVLGALGAGTAPAWAYLLPVAGMLALAVGTLLDRARPAATGIVADLAGQTVAAGIALVALAAATGDLAPPAEPSFWLAVLWVVVLSTVGGYGCYFLVLRARGPATVSTLLYLTPPVTALWAWVQFGQAPGPGAVPGAVLCAAAVWLVVRPSRRLTPPGRRRPLRPSTSSTT